jgi:hypothetical protein
MAKRYRPVDRDQSFLLPPDMREWLPEDHLAWLVIAVIAEIDTTAFHARPGRSWAGRSRYDPDMMLTLLVYAYANKVLSSRRIEALCAVDVAFRLARKYDVRGAGGSDSVEPVSLEMVAVFGCGDADGQAASPSTGWRVTL